MAAVEAHPAGEWAAGHRMSSAQTYPLRAKRISLSILALAFLGNVSAENPAVTQFVAIVKNQVAGLDSVTCQVENLRTRREATVRGAGMGRKRH